MAHFGFIFPIFGAKKIFLTNPALSCTTSYGFLAPCKNLEKFDDTIQRKHPNRQKDRQKDGRVEGWKDRQTLFYRTLPATAKDPIRRKKTEHFKIMKKNIMAAWKCKNMLLQVALKDFWSSADPNLKKKICQNSHFFRIILKKKSKNRGFQQVTFVFKQFNSQLVFKEKLNSEGLQTYERNDSHVMM